MTAHDFLAQIFSRPSFGLASNMRRLTAAQLDLLARLIGEDEEGGAVDRGLGGSFTWLPSGRNKYVIAEDPRGRGGTVERLSNLRPSGCGRLF